MVYVIKRQIKEMNSWTLFWREMGSRDEGTMMEKVVHVCLSDKGDNSIRRKMMWNTTPSKLAMGDIFFFENCYHNVKLQRSFECVTDININVRYIFLHKSFKNDRGEALIFRWE